MQTGKLKQATLRLITTVMAVTILFIACLSASFAWFAMQIKSGGQVGFQSGKLDGVSISIATVENKMDETSRKYFEYAFAQDGQNGKFGIDEPISTDNKYQIAITDMSFGSIDNLSRLKPENIVYIKIAIPKKYGTGVRFNIGSIIDENGYFFDIYRNIYDADNKEILHQEKVTAAEFVVNGSTVDGASILEGLKNIQAEKEDGDETKKGEKFLQYAYAFSHEEISAPDLASKQESGDLVFETYTKPLDSSTVELTVPEGLTDKNSADDNYYLYVKITPNLTAFSHSIEYLAIIMPCYVLFKVGLSFEIYSTASENTLSETEVTE